MYAVIDRESQGTKSHYLRQYCDANSYIRNHPECINQKQAQCKLAYKRAFVRHRPHLFAGNHTDEGILSDEFAAKPGSSEQMSAVHRDHPKQYSRYANAESDDCETDEHCHDEHQAKIVSAPKPSDTTLRIGLRFEPLL